MNDTIRVLVADDNDLVREMIIDSLSDDPSIEVVGSAADGEAAIDQIIQKKPDVALLDLVMPKVDGLGVIEQIEEMTDYTGKKPCFIVISAVGKEDIVSRILQAGAVYFIMKPFDGDVLKKRIRIIVDDIRSGREGGKQSFGSPALEDTLENKATALIRSLGVPVKMIGYKYLRDAIVIALEDEDSLMSVTKNVYPHIADSYDTSPSNVERNIRYVIESTWNKSDDIRYTDKIKEVFKGVVKKPTNSEFILMCSEWIKLGN